MGPFQKTCTSTQCLFKDRDEFARSPVDGGILPIQSIADQHRSVNTTPLSMDNSTRKEYEHNDDKDLQLIEFEIWKDDSTVYFIVSLETWPAQEKDAATKL